MERAAGILAILSNIQCGIWLSHCFLMDSKSSDLMFIGPILASSVASMLIGIKLSVCQSKCKNANFYYLLLGSGFMLVQGILFMANESYPEYAYYVGAVGHGIQFVTAVSYIFLETDPKIRSVKIGASYSFYLIAFAGGYLYSRMDAVGVIYYQGIAQTWISGLTIGLICFIAFIAKGMKMYQEPSNAQVGIEYTHKGPLYTVLH